MSHGQRIMSRRGSEFTEVVFVAEVRVGPHDVSGPHPHPEPWQLVFCPLGPLHAQCHCHLLCQIKCPLWILYNYFALNSVLPTDKITILSFLLVSVQ